MKRFTLKRITALVLALIMTLSLCPVTALAESSTVAGEQICVAEEIFVTEEETDESTFLEKEEKTLISSEEEDSITQKVDSEYVVEPTATSLPIANSVVSAAQAQWGVADGASVPVEWAGSGDLDAAINYANGLENCVAYIQLLSDVKTSAPLYFLESRTAILDLNGKTIDRGRTSASYSGCVIDVKGELTLCDTSTEKNGKVTGGYTDFGGGGVRVSGTFTMNGGMISGNIAYYGGGVYVDEGSFTMNGGTISGNTSDYRGGGVEVYFGTFTMNGGVISGNTAKNYGGGVYVWRSIFNISGTPNISGNTVGKSANNVYLDDSSISTMIVDALSVGASIGVTVALGTFSAGGGEYANSGYFYSDNSDYIVISDGNGNLKLTENIEARWGLVTGTDNTEMPTSWTIGTVTKAMHYANGLSSGTTYIQLLKDVKTTGTLTFNSGKTTILDLNGYDIDRGLTGASSIGNVITVFGNLTLCDTSVSASGKITGGNLSNNNDGGAGVRVDGGIFTLSSGFISGNVTAREHVGFGIYHGTNGGGVYVNSGGTFYMSGGTITENTAAGNGGGVYIGGDATFVMSGGTISDNTAEGNGGGVYVWLGTFNISGAPNISENIAGTTASNVHLYSNSTITVDTLSTGAHIGVTREDGSGTFTSGGTAYADSDYFFSDSTAYTVDADGLGNLRLVYTEDPVEARWGLASGTNNDGMPTSWVSGALDDAIAVANSFDSGTLYVQLIADVDINSVLTFNKTTVLDLNGYDINRGLTEATDSGNVITVSGNLTLCDTSSTEIENQGQIRGGYNTTYGGGVYVAGGTFTINSGSINNNKVDCKWVDSGGGGVYVAFGASFTMNGGVIGQNTVIAAVSDCGGGGVRTNGTFIMNGGSIIYNTLTSAKECSGGGGVYDGATFTMNGGCISNNTVECDDSDSGGGGVYIDHYDYRYPAVFTLNGGTIDNNTAKCFNYRSGGGGVHLRRGTMAMTDGLISKNELIASDSITGGGGVCTSSLFSMNGGSISENAGIGVYVFDTYNSEGSFAMSGGSISKNEVGVEVEGTISIFDTPLIFDNKTKNVHVDSENLLVVGALNDGANIGVTPYTVATNEMPATIATGNGYTLTASDAAKFVGDDGSFGALNSVNNTVELKLAKANLSGADVVAPGSEVTLLLNVSGTGIAGMEGTLEYDSNLLEYVRCKSVATDWEMTQNDATYVMTSDGAPVTSETGILAVTFRVKDTASVGTQLNVFFKNATLTDGSNTFNIGDITWNGVADAASTDATFTGNEIVSAGSKVTLTMALSGDGITSAEMLLNYDDGVLEYVSYRALHNDWSVTKDGDKFTLTGEDRPISSAAELLAVTFLVKRNVPVGAMVSAAFTNIVTSDGVVSSNVGTAFWRASVNGTTEAQWGLATGDNSDQAPITWVGSGTLVDATYYANELTEGVAYIQLIDDVVDTTAPLEFASGKTTVLDLNGNTIDRGLTKPTYDGNVITVKGNLTLCDTSAAATGKITGGNIKGDYSSECSGGGVIVNENGAFTMNGGNISNNTAYADGGGVIVNYNGAFTMNGGTISNNATNASYGYGGGVCAYYTFAMNGGTISGNAAHYGGGVYASRTFTMSGGDISNNIVDGDGGGVYANNTFTMTGGKISANTAGKNGGGVYGNLAMRGGTISGNNAENGGGVYGSGTMKLSGGTITGNVATGEYYDYGSYGYYNGGYGGGVYCSNLQVWGTPVITGNMATGILSGQSEVKDNWREQNVYLTGEKITAVSKLKDGASIGITASLSYGETSRVVVTGIDTAPAYTLTESDAAKFVGDPGCVLSYDSTNNAVVMGLRAQSYTVSGTITSYHNASDTITVGLYVGDSAVPRYVTTFTGNSASYSLVNVEPGTYTMKVSKADHPPYQCTVTVYNSNVLQNVALSYVPVAKKYTVTFVIDDEIVSTQTVEEGKSAVLPTIPAKENYDQVMPYWDKSGTNITSDTTITAVYTPNKYPVTFIADGVTVDTQTVEYGKSATLPKIPVKEGYDQTEPYWNHRGESITGSTVITAVYTINKYTVTFVAAGSVIGRQTVSHGGDATLPDVPPKEGESPITPYWNHDGKNITTDTIVSAVYTDEAYLVNGAVTSSLDSVGDVTVTLYLDSNPIAVYGATVNDNDGCYVIEGVESGTYTMKVSKPGYMTREYKVVVGSQAITQDVAICPKGDVNLDGEVNADDLTALARHVAKIEHLTDNYALQCADVDDNGMLSADDLTKLARYVAKIISTL